MGRKIYLSLFIVLFFLTSCSTQSSIQIKNAWARPGVEGSNSAVYFLIENYTNEEDTLIGVQSDIAEHVEMHRSTMENGVMKMEQQEMIPIEDRTTVEFKPGDYHIMLINLDQELSPGDTFNIALIFEESGEEIIEVVVKEP